MKSIEFEEQTLIIAEHQDEYVSLPAYVDPHEGSITACFEPSKEDLEILNNGGKIWYSQMVGNGKMQPIRMTTEKPKMGK